MDNTISCFPTFRKGKTNRNSCRHSTSDLRSASSESASTSCVSTPESRSVSTVSASTGSHNFEICNYSLIKGLGMGKKVESMSFTVGGLDWKISCYLDRDNITSSDCISVFLEYCPISDEKARVKFSFFLLDHATGAATSDKSALHIFSSSSLVLGWARFIKRDVFEASSCLRNDSLTIICNITIIREPQTHDPIVPMIVKPSVLEERLGDLMSIEKGADIIFEVDGQSFPAHRCVVAASSPVFEALLSGLMKEGNDKLIKINYIDALVFKALLLYIYTNELQEIEELTVTGMAQHLLVAADQFGLDKLRISCEKKLHDGFSISNVCTTLALADQHDLSNLKSACLVYLSSPKALIRSMATDGFTHLISSCPNIAKEIHNRINIADLK